MIVGKEIYTLHVSKRVQRSLFYSASMFAAIAAIVTIGVYGTSFTGAPQVFTARASDTLAVWWPTDSAHLTGVQPFKAMVENSAIDQYDMYWQVDGGSENPMHTSLTDYPHKEADVDVSSWNWRDSHVYTVTFIAKKDGAVISQHSVEVNTESTQAQGIVLTMQEEVKAPESASAETQQPAVFSTAPQVLQVEDTPPIVQQQTQPQPAQSDSKLKIWWPSNGAKVSGEQPFKAVVEDTAVDQYDMYWQVDNGIPVLMQTNTDDSPHKEAGVNVSNWSWKGSGPYDISFTARNKNGTVIAKQDIAISIGTDSAPAASQNQASVIQAVSAPVASTNQAAPVVALSAAAVSISGVATKVVQASSGANPLSGETLYVDPDSHAKAQAEEWSKNRSGDADAMRTLASAATAVWLGSWNDNVSRDVSTVMKKAGNSVPTFVVYNIPGRDCSGGYSSGGASSDDAYRSFVEKIANAIGGKKAIVVLEPDSLADLSCLSQDRQDARVNLLSNAVSTLKKNAKTVVYLDAGHSGWTPANTMASNLKKAGIASADGFAVNVSNFDSTANSTSYSEQISAQLGSKHYVIDTSRNGKGAGDNWCNPDGRAIGFKPTVSTGNMNIDAYLWLKTPGESDGSCNGGPGAGQWWPDYALKLVRNAGQ